MSLLLLPPYAMLAGAQVRGGGATDDYPYVNTETATYVAAMSVKPNDTRKAAIDTLISVFKTVGWSKFGVIYIHRCHDEQAGRLNAQNPGTNTLTPINSPTFTTDGGFASDGSTSYLDLGIDYAAIPGLAQDDVHLLGAYTGTASTGAHSWGRLNSLGRYSLSPGTGSGTTVQARLSTSGTISKTYTGLAMYAAVRRGATSSELYKDGVSLGTDTTASSDVGSGSARLLNSSGSFAPTTARLELSTAGSQLSTADLLALKAGWDAYVGAL